MTNTSSSRNDAAWKRFEQALDEISWFRKHLGGLSSRPPDGKTWEDVFAEDLSEIRTAGWALCALSERQPTRDETIEECAKVCDEARVLVDGPVHVAKETAASLARQIRDLKTQKPIEKCPHGHVNGDRCFLCSPYWVMCDGHKGNGYCPIHGHYGNR